MTGPRPAWPWARRLGALTVALLALEALAAAVAWRASAPSASPITPACSRPVAVVASGRTRLGCATEAALEPLARAELEAGDLVRLTPLACRVPQGMPQALRRTVGLPVDLNRADAAVLVEVPGLGPSLARRIEAYRAEHGPFATVAALRRVRGIGATRFAQAAPSLTVASGGPGHPVGPLLCPDG